MWENICATSAWRISKQNIKLRAIKIQSDYNKNLKFCPAKDTRNKVQFQLRGISSQRVNV